MLFARDGLALVAADMAAGLGQAELGEAQRASCSLRFVLRFCVGLPVQAGSRPGGRGTFFVRTKKVPKESRPASTPRLRRGPLRCSKHRVAAELALAALGARTVLALAALGARTVLATAALRASEPDASALLGVSEGEGKASTLHRCRISVAWMQAKGRNPGSEYERLAAALDSAPLHPDCEHETSVAPKMVLNFGSRRERRTDVSAGGAVRTRCLRRVAPSSRGRPTGDAAVRAARRAANAGSPFLGYFFWRSKRSNTPAGGGTPAEARLLGVIRRSARWASMPSAQATPTPTRDHDRQCQNMRRRPWR